MPWAWLALFFGMLTMGKNVAIYFGNVPKHSINDEMAQCHWYQHLAAQALSLADVSKPQPYIIEALAVFVSGLHVIEKSSELRMWLVIGVILRLLLRMGYHRDPGQYSEFTPFQCEMRRRVWTNLFVFDTMSSASIGLPGGVDTSGIETSHH